MPTIMKDTKPRKKPITWDQAFDLYLTHLHARRASPLTVAAYESNLRHLVSALPSRSSPSEVTLDDLRNLQCRIMSGEASRSKRPPSASTVSGITTSWRSFFKFLYAEERIERDPAVRLEHPRVPKRTPQDALTVKEVERLLDTPDAFTPKGLRDRALLDLVYSTGLRNAEFRSLDLCDVDHQEREIKVMGKGEKGRIVPLTRSAYARLKDYLDRARPVLAAKAKGPTEALFLSKEGRRITPDLLRWLLPRAKAAAGIKKRLTPHTLRRGVATHLVRAGASVVAVQHLLGHKSLDTTAIYVEVRREDLRKAVDTLDHK